MKNWIGVVGRRKKNGRESIGRKNKLDGKKLDGKKNWTKNNWTNKLAGTKNWTEKHWTEKVIGRTKNGRQNGLQQIVQIKNERRQILDGQKMRPGNDPHETGHTKN